MKLHASFVLILKLHSGIVNNKQYLSKMKSGRNNQEKSYLQDVYFQKNFSNYCSTYDFFGI